MNFLPGLKIKIAKENAVVVFVDTISVLVEFANAERKIYSKLELLRGYELGQVRVYDEQGRMYDPDGFSQEEEALIASRLPYASRFLDRPKEDEREDEKVDRKAIINEIGTLHQLQKPFPSVATCYRWASNFRKYGRAGLLNKRKNRGVSPKDPKELKQTKLTP